MNTSFVHSADRIAFSWNFRWNYFPEEACNLKPCGNRNSWAWVPVNRQVGSKAHDNFSPLSILYVVYSNALCEWVQSPRGKELSKLAQQIKFEIQMQSETIELIFHVSNSTIFHSNTNTQRTREYRLIGFRGIKWQKYPLKVDEGRLLFPIKHQHKRNAVYIGVCLFRRHQNTSDFEVKVFIGKTA